MINPDGLNLENIAFAAWFVLTVYYLSKSFVLLYRQSIKRLMPASQIIFSLIILWWCITSIRGFTTDFNTFSTWISHPAIGGLPWFLPLALLYGINRDNIIMLYPTFYRHVIIGSALTLLVTLALYFEYPLDIYSQISPRYLLYGVLFLIYVGWGSKKQRFVLYIGVISSFVIGYYYDSRTDIVVNLSFVLLYLTLPSVSEYYTNKSIINFFARLILVLPMAYFLAQETLPNLDESYFKDSRSFLVEELFDDLSMFENIVGRGSLGKYFSQHFHDWSRAGMTGGDSEFRQSIESGYLFLILKAGFISVALFIIVSFTAIANALKPPISKLDVCIIVILLSQLTIMSVSSTYSHYSPQNILSWILIGAGLGKNSRNKH